MWGVGLNAILGYIVVITLCFTITDPQALLDSPTGSPFIQLFYNVTKSYNGTNIMTAIIVINIVSAVISEIATASRQIWSFARDDGFPFSSFLKQVSDLIPRNTLGLVDTLFWPRNPKTTIISSNLDQIKAWKIS